MLEEKGYGMSVFDPYFVPDEAVLLSTYDFVTCTEAAEVRSRALFVFSCSSIFFF